MECFISSDLERKNENNHIIFEQYYKIIFICNRFSNKNKRFIYDYVNILYYLRTKYQNVFRLKFFLNKNLRRPLP